MAGRKTLIPTLENEMNIAQVLTESSKQNKHVEGITGKDKSDGAHRSSQGEEGAPAPLPRSLPSASSEKAETPAFNVMAGQQTGVVSTDTTTGVQSNLSTSKPHCENNEPLVTSNEKQTEPTSFSKAYVADLEKKQKKYGKKIDLTDAVKKDSGKFDLCNKYIHLTYKGHHDEPQLVKFIGDEMSIHEPGLKIKTYSCVNEMGKLKEEMGDPYAHCHIAIEFNRAPKRHIRNPRFFDYKGVHPHIQRCKKQHFRYICIEYHTKDGVPFTNVDTEEEITFLDLQEMWEKSKSDRTNVNHALLETMEKKGIPMTKAGPMKTALDLSKPTTARNPQKYKELRPFQQEMMNMLELDYVSNRVIGYVWDQQGAFGKSWFSRLLYDTGKAFICRTYSSGDAIEALRTHIADRGEPQIIIIDVPRGSSVSSSAMFTLAETFKDEVMTAAKYKSDTLAFEKIPHVWIFSNTRPDVSGISTDRLDIRIPSIKGKTYDYSFEGVDAKDYNDYIQNIELLKFESEKEYEICKPIRQRIDIETFKKIRSDMLTPEKIRPYWDRGVFPQITMTIGCRPGSSSGPICEFEELPLTEQEIIDYQESKKGRAKDAKELDLKRRQKASDEYMEKWKNSITEEMRERWRK